MRKKGTPIPTPQTTYTNKPKQRSTKVLRFRDVPKEPIPIDNTPPKEFVTNNIVI